MNRARIGRLSPVLSVLSFVALTVGLALVVQNVGNRSKSREFCRSVLFLTLIAAPTLALAGIATGLITDSGRGTARPRIGFLILSAAVLIFAGLSTGPPLWLDIRGCSPPSSESVVTVTCLPGLHSAIAGHTALHGSVPETLEDLGDDSDLLRGKEAGYRFIYMPGPLEADGTRKRYTIVARPIEFGKTGSQNFFIDESGIRRFTIEDRPATAADCPVEKWQTCKR